MVRNRHILNLSLNTVKYNLLRLKNLSVRDKNKSIERVKISIRNKYFSKTDKSIYYNKVWKYLG